MSDIPTIKDELERKTIQEVNRLAQALANKTISPAAYKEALLTLWNLSSGLIDSETMDVIAQINNDAPPTIASNQMASVLRGPDGTWFILRGFYGQEKVFLTRVLADGAKTVTKLESRNLIFPAAGAVALFNSAKQRLIETGYTQLL